MQTRCRLVVTRSTGSDGKPSCYFHISCPSEEEVCRPESETDSQTASFSDLQAAPAGASVSYSFFMLKLCAQTLLITLCCCHVSKVTADQHHPDYQQLAGTVKLLQLQLKQTVETVEHISTLLSAPDRPGSAQPPSTAPSKVTLQDEAEGVGNRESTSTVSERGEVTDHPHNALTSSGATA